MNSAFLESSEIIDWQTPSVRQLAEELGQQSDGELDVTRRTFEWVRDNIQHSLDYQRTEITCRASDVLLMRTGYCYAKSHLLAALLRSNGIPAGFCYQRLTLNGDKPPHCLHGLNAVYLSDHGWYRVDARGNKPGVDAQFTPPTERLAFSTLHDGEYDVPEIWPEPLSIIVQSLQNASSVQALATCLPDMPINEMLAIGNSSVTTPIIRCS